LREIEILHDHLLRLFQDDPSLQPRDVLVMAPDIESHAPYIRAVFGTPESDSARIPYSLADQSSRTRSKVIDVFLRVIELGISNFANSRVLDVLQSELIRTRFELTALDLERIRRWVDDSGIIRGLDAAHRARLGLAGSAEFSWAHGTATWILGYAMNGEGRRLYAELLPYTEMEGDHLDTLDRLLTALDCLREIAEAMRLPKTPPQWGRALLHLIQRLFGTETNFAVDLHVLRDALSALADSDPWQRDERVPAEVIIESLDHRLHETAVAGGFLDGRVTFCSLKPMRAIPARVVCLLGMNESDFPRQDSRPSFDLLATEPRKGDRSLRDDDRYLFLEALLSTREHLCIS
ncbi:MAG: exonuclease V subunit gamma, partial [Gammaproteobacteria bacterium]|nr:exonuclease V subunit gamma [Gammaproteobacteria bacterium]